MESVDVHTGHLNRQSYKGIAVVCQFCEFNADRVPILTADYADDTDKRSCCPRTTRKTRSPTAQKIRKIGTQEASEGGKSGSHERIRNRREFPGFLVSRLCAFHCGRHGRPTSLCLLCLDVSLSRRKNLRKSASICGLSEVRHLAGCHCQAGSRRPRVAAATKAILQSKCRTSINMAPRIVHLRLYRAKKITTLFARS